MAAVANPFDHLLELLVTEGRAAAEAMVAQIAARGLPPGSVGVALRSYVHDDRVTVIAEALPGRPGLVTHPVVFGPPPPAVG